ncbi:endo-beta-N-acetylglucosaminidase [Asticcacaulis solisilvae]|uniref:endo-beta-N-acetylglucosaminidase n=1 Tax=Asticcacaulis solisilvae TaxID=1217274 RepID=UPI003FD7231B
MSLFSPDRRGFLAMTMAAACLPAAARAQAASLAPVYPLSHGDAWTTFAAYDPETDPDAPYYRSHVRKVQRIAPFAATQAHPKLDAHTSSGTLVAAYLTLDGPDVDYNRRRYAMGAGGRVHVERAWQYQDVVVGWNTTGLVPNAGLIDAAHRNGALCLGTMFQPDKRMFDGTAMPRPEVAKKLVKLAQYFGFDGYFVNFESYTADDARAVQDLIGLMKAEAKTAGLSDFHIQYYNGYTDARAVWPGSPHVDGTPREADALRADSMMIDQGWSHYGMTRGCCSGPALNALPSPADLGQTYDPMAVFYGLQLYPGPGYFGLIAPTVIAPNGTGGAKGGLQIYSVEDGLRKMRRARLDALRASTSLSAPDKAELLAWTDPKTSRAKWYQLHNSFWAGQTGNPARDNAPSLDQTKTYGAPEVRKVYTDYEAPGKPTDQIRLPITWGVANFITERSVVGALPFATSFNTGEGDRFFHQGQAVATTPWFNLGSQDVLPTWTWWTKPMHGGGDGALTVDYDYDTAWDGSASLRVSGKLTAKTATELRLFKTGFAVPAGFTVGLTGKGETHDALRLGLIFEDAPSAVDWVKVAAKPSPSGWWTWQQDLGRYAGRKLAALSLGFEGAGTIDIHIGRLSLTAGPARPLAAPQGFTVAASRVAGQSAEIRLQWTHDPATDHYDLFAGTVWLGRISGDRYYVEALKRPAGASTTTLRLVATGGDGATSATTATFDWTA